MEILIKQPLALYESGEQNLNQDFIFPLVDQANPEERLFIICDGEGGSQAGEVASKLVALSIAKYFASTPPQGPIDQAYLDNALKKAEGALTAYKDSHTESQNMRTSLSLLHLGEEQATLAWVGSCRVYFFDDDRQALKIAGSEPGTADAKSAISGLDNPQQIHLKYIPNSEIGPKDYFFLASDGMLEQVDAQTLESLFKPGSDESPEFLMNEIRNLTHNFTQDNYSAYLIRVDKVSDGTPVLNPLVPETPGASNSSDDAPESSAAGKGWLRNAMFFVLLMVFGGVILLAWWYSRPRGYYAFMDQANSLMDEQKYEEAIVMYDSAIANTDDPNLSDKAAGRRAEATAALGGGGLASGIDPNFDPTESAEAYLDRGNAFFENNNYRGAITAYQQARVAKEQQNDQRTEIPLTRLAESYLMVGNELFEAENKNCQDILTEYEAGFSLYQSPEVSRDNDSLLQLAMERAQTCNKLLGQAASESLQRLAQGEDAPPKDRSAPLASAENAEGEEPTATNSLNALKPSGSPSPSASSPAGEENVGGATPPSSTNARVAPKSDNLTTRSLDPQKAADMKRRLSDGKRLFVQATSSESGYQYKISIENLEQAEAVLDGSGAYMLAYMYHMGLAGEKDAAKALKFAQKSAQLDWAAGQYLYGHLLLNRKYPRDSVTAIQVLEKASDQNYLKAIERLREIR